MKPEKITRLDQRPRRLSVVRSSAPSQGHEPMQKLGSFLRMKTPEQPADAKLYWTCEVCGPIEPLALPTGRWIKRSCICMRKEREEEQQRKVYQAWLAHQKARTFGGWLGERWENERTISELTRKTFATYDQSCFPHAYRAARQFSEQPKGNLLLHGTYGTGKTHLEAAICNYLREVKQVSSLFVSAPLFFMAYNDAQRDSRDQTRLLSLMQQVIEAEVMVLDDVDKARPTDARWDTYFLILDERYKARRPTVLSTNKEETLYEYIGEAAYSRIMRGLISIEMVGDDYRLEEEV